MVKKGLYLKLKEMEFDEIKGTIFEKSFDKSIDALLKFIILDYGLNAIRNKLDTSQKYNLQLIIQDKEFWNDISCRFNQARYNVKEENGMGIYKSWLANVEAGLNNKWAKDETRTPEEIHSLAIAGCCLWISTLEVEWSKGTISKEHNNWLEKVTSDNDYWADWEIWKKVAKDVTKIGMSKEEYDTAKERIEKMAEQKAETTTLTICERNDAGTMQNSTSSATGGSWVSSGTSWVSSYNKPPVGFCYHGRKNKTILPEFIDICRMTQKTLKKYLVKRLKRYYDKENICARDGFIFVKGEIPVMVTAHMDTVHKEVIKDYYEWTEKQEDKTKGTTYNVHVLSSPQGIGGDDRCGIWMILQILECGYRPFIIFNEDEEIGCVGASKFCKKCNVDLHNMCKEIKFIIELDRKGKHDLVFYNCDNDDFTKWCEKTTGWKEAYGSCSDISYIAPELGCAAVNLSCGYYDEHKLWHTVKIEEMFNTLSTAIKMIEASETVERFKYIEAFDYYKSNWGGYHNDYDYDYDYDNEGYDRSNSDKYGTCVIDFDFWAYDKEADDWIKDFATIRGWRYSECYEKFFKRHPNVCYADITKTIERYDYGHNNTYYGNNRTYY